MTYYVGDVNQTDLLGANNPRYFLALRRTDDGLLYFAKIDQIKDTEAITINEPGLSEGDYENFDYGVDFFDGRNISDHAKAYKNLKWDQYRWDSKNTSYYIDTQGNLVVRINQEYSYPPGSQVG